MREYTVIATATQTLETTIYAETQEEANRLAENTDGSEFFEIEQESKWTIQSVSDNGIADPSDYE